ncbi:MAG: (Fe-S)-binding protein [Deltaproteobacteria bacterium]|nr:(Fe-S)-binding protein [Deltaproteobacteria bacterium]
MMNSELLRKEIGRCVVCGTCRSVCPTTRVLNRETSCARGKLTLIGALSNGEIQMSEEYVRHIKECALCGACKDSCPNGVDTVGAFVAARAEIVAKQGLPFAAQMILKALIDPGGLKGTAIKIAGALQGLFLKDASAEAGLVSRFSLPVIGGGRLLPPLAKQTFLEMSRVKTLAVPIAQGTSVKKVAFYAGCGVNYLMPQVGSATLDVLERAGVAICVPPEQVCCGMPAYSMGDKDTARAMALKNLEAFEAYDVDYITTSCATCGHGLKKLFKELLSDDPALSRRVSAFSAKVRDITELLTNELGFIGKAGAKAAEEKVTVTYHDPCHLNRAQGIRREPRALLANAPSLSYKEMRFPCSCCGLGGGLSTTNYDLSIEISRRKAESIALSGAQVVATACPGCIVQLRDALHRYGVDAKVAHVVELL